MAITQGTLGTGRGGNAHSGARIANQMSRSSTRSIGGGMDMDAKAPQAKPLTQIQAPQTPRPRIPRK